MSNKICYIPFHFKKFRKRKNHGKSRGFYGTSEDNGLKQKVVVTKSVTTTRSGCGGRTRTYDLRVMSCSPPNFPLPHKDFLRFLPPFSNNPGGHKSITAYRVHSLMTPYGSAYGSKIRVHSLGSRTTPLPLRGRICYRETAANNTN